MVLIFFVIFKPNLNNESKTDYIKNNPQKSKRVSNPQLMDIQRTISLIPCTNTDRDVNRANVPCEYMQRVKNRLGIFDDSGHLGMSKSELHLARLYINTIKLSITNALYIQFPGLIDGSSWPPAGQGTGQAITMTGIRRIDNLQMVLEDVIVRQLDGDFIELGVWKGGLCILATSIFHAYKQYNRKVFLADSFDGIPAVNTSVYPADAAHVGTNNLEILSGKYTGGMQTVVKNFNLYFNVQSNRNLINIETFSQIETKQDPLESEFSVKLEFLKVFLLLSRDERDRF